MRADKSYRGKDLWNTDKAASERGLFGLTNKILSNIATKCQYNTIRETIVYIFL